MKYIKQVSTGKAVYREEPHTDKTLQNASIEHKIPVNDLEVVDESLTDEQWNAKAYDAKPWALKMKASDSTMIPRWLEDHIRDDHGGVAGNANLQAKYDQKVALRNSKPS